MTQCQDLRGEQVVNTDDELLRKEIISKKLLFSLSAEHHRVQTLGEPSWGRGWQRSGGRPEQLSARMNKQLLQ